MDIKKLLTTHKILFSLFFVSIGMFIVVVALPSKNILFLSNVKSIWSKQAEPSTELYFTNHQNLPKQIELETLYKYEFSIENKENNDTTYTYEITTEDENSKNTLYTRKLFLKHDEKINVPVTFTILEPFERMKITVKLVNKNQEIHFWTEQE